MRFAIDVAAVAMTVTITVAATAGALSFPTHAASTLTLDDLMRTLAQRGPENARFVEKKYLAVLDNKPIESSGELRYAPPNRIEKKTLKPKPESLIVEGDQAIVERNGQRMTLRLSAYPDIAPFVDSIRGTLAGDRNSLERVYRLELSGDAERWTLLMLPSDQKLATIVQRIDVAGNRDQVRSIAILQGDGDRSVMTIDRIDLPKPIPK